MQTEKKYVQMVYIQSRSFVEGYAHMVFHNSVFSEDFYVSY